MWALDGSDFPKQGRKSVGVARQYCGRLGKVANCQAGMFLAYVSPLGRALVDKGLYLPESWTSDKDRCEAAGVPEDRQGYRSKTELALEMVGRAQERGHLKAGWVAADDAFGMSPSFREGLAALGMWYVLDVPSGFTVLRSIRDSGVPANPGCETVSAGPSCRRRPGDYGGRGKPGNAATCDRPAGASPAKSTGPFLPVQCSGGYPVGDPGIRGTIETEFETEKSDVGLDEYEPAPGLAGPWAELFCLQQACPGNLPGGALPRERFGPTELLRWLEDTQDSNCGHHPTSLPELTL